MPKEVRQLLAFDFGLRQIGCASGQTITNAAAPQRIFNAKDGVPDWQSVVKFIDEWNPDAILVGLPINMDGTESELSARARKFAKRIHGRTGRTVWMVDERLSSREAKRLADEDRDLDRTEMDHYAAAVILQSWLNDPSLAQPC